MIENSSAIISGYETYFGDDGYIIRGDLLFVGDPGNVLYKYIDYSGHPSTTVGRVETSVGTCYVREDGYLAFNEVIDDGKGLSFYVPQAIKNTWCGGPNDATGFVDEDGYFVFDKYALDVYNKGYGYLDKNGNCSEILPVYCTTCGHKRFVDTMEPTCSNEGKIVLTCWKCKTKAEQITAPKLNHKIIYDNPVAPTCTDDGFTKGSHCSECGEIFVAQKLIPATGHDKKFIEEKQPTCTSDGYRKYVCTVCGEEIVEPIKALGHTVIVEPGNNATCTQNGITDSKYCSVCGEILQTHNVIPAKGHNFTDWTVAIYPTCTNYGLKVRVCKDCNYTETEQIEKIPHVEECMCAVESSCTSTGLTEGIKCSTCGQILKPQEVIPKKSHEFVLDKSKSKESTCIEQGINYYRCANCGESLVTKLSLKPHQYELIERVESTPNVHGYEVFKCKNCDTKYNEFLPYKSDNSLIFIAIIMGDMFDFDDFDEESFNLFKDILQKCTNISKEDTKQTDIDNAITEFLTAIYDLVPYADLNIKSDIGKITVNYDNLDRTELVHSILFGTDITLKAEIKDGYEFVGWYETIAGRYLSKDTIFEFEISSNMNIEAVYVKNQSATITFANETGWIKDQVTKTATEWLDITDITDLLPEVPYKYGHTNGRWNYVLEDVLTQLRAGQDVTITPLYDDNGFVKPDIPQINDTIVPNIKLDFEHDKDNKVGSFIMTAGIPEGCRINSIGVAFYYGKADKFKPDEMILTLQNKALVSQFDKNDRKGTYIVDVKRFTAKHNWAARGYITYYDAQGVLQTAYSNQVSVVGNKVIPNKMF